MTTLVRQHEKGAKQGLVAYQDIFDAYCSKYQAFDPDHFRQIVNWYVNTKYLRPKAEPDRSEGPTVPRPPLVPRDPFKPPRPDVPGPVIKGGTKTGTEVPEDNRPCQNPKCVFTRQVYRAAMEHIARLETRIEQNLGKEYIPTRPKILEINIQ